MQLFMSLGSNLSSCYLFSVSPMCSLFYITPFLHSSEFTGIFFFFFLEFHFNPFVDLLATILRYVTLVAAL